MQRTDLLLGVLLGVALVGVAIGAASAIDKLQGPEITDVTVERLNDTHAAVAWTTENPTYGRVHTLVSRHCPPGWGSGVNTVEDSAFKRAHVVVAPIYDVNKSRMNLSNVRGHGALKQYEVKVAAWDREETTADFQTIVKRNLSQACG